MTNLLNLKKKWEYTSEEELNQIYLDQYNDVFSKILLLNSTQFMNVLEKQIITHLYIIKKQPIISLLSRISEYFIQKYYDDREKVYQSYQLIKQTNTNDLEYLDKFNCYLHCPHTSEAFHTCGNKFILCNDFIFCLQCKKVYNEEQAKMLCDFCGVEYYTKLREIESEEYENYFPVCCENSHCPSEKEEKLKCKNCKEDLYIDISKYNNLNKNENDKNKKIDNLYCIKCRLNFRIKDLDLKCLKCNKKFFSEIKIYNEFNNLKTDYLCLVHTLLKRKYAIPKNIKKRTCKCELINCRKYKHNSDKGNLLEGLRYGKKVIICDKCFKIFNYYTFNWNCPECGILLNGNNNSLLTKDLIESSSVSYKLDQDKGSLKQNSKYNTTASNTRIKNIYPNNNKSENKNGKVTINNLNEKNNNEINNSKILRGAQNTGNNISERRSGAYNTNNTFDKENKKNSSNIRISNVSNNKSNNNIQNINSNRSNLRDNKKIFNKINVNEENHLTNINDKNQTSNSLINSINNSIKLKNNFNDKNSNNNNKTCIITFNGIATNEKNDSTNNSNKSNISKGLGSSKILSPDNKNEKFEYSLKYHNSKDVKNNKEKVVSIDKSKNDNKVKRSHNYVNVVETKNNLGSKGNSKNKRKTIKNEETNENNNLTNSNNINKIRKISIKDQIKNNNNDNHNLIKIDLGKKENILMSAKSSINIHSVNNNLIKNNLNNNNNNKQVLRGKNDQNKNVKSPQKVVSNGIKKTEHPKIEIIKRNFSSNRNKLDKEINNINLNNNKNNNERKISYINNRNKKSTIEDNVNNNNNIEIKNSRIKNSENLYTIGDSTSNEDSKLTNNLSLIKKNQSVSLLINKNRNSSSKRKLNKVNINDYPNEENDKNKNLGEKIIQRNRGSPNHKRVDIVQTKNNNKGTQNNIHNINVKLSHDLSNLNANILNKSQNGKDLKDSKIMENKPLNRSVNIVYNINDKDKKNNRNNSSNSNNNSIISNSNSNNSSMNNISNINNQKNKKINNIYKSSNSNSIGVIQQEDNEDDNSYDYNATKSINLSSSKSKNEEKIIEHSQSKSKLVENRYSNFNENNQIINENNIYIHDKKDNEEEKPKKEEKEEKEDKDDKSTNSHIYIKHNSEKIENNKLYSNHNSSKINISSMNSMNESSKNISSEGYQFNCDNYNIVQLLGEGTFGKIYLVEDPSDLKKYALKKISVSDMEELGENKKEFELLMKLSQDNPNLNVVKIFGIQVKKLDKFNLVMYVLMEAAQCDWECEIKNRNQYQAYYTEEELMKILTNLTKTLACLQKQGICHRDVKPQNILCFGKDDYKLSDFGEAKKKKKRKINGNCIYDFEGDTSKQTVRGTELYMSPILFKALHDCPEIDLEYNAYKSDVFSLGLCMLLSSTLGFQALYDIRELYDNNKMKKIIEKSLSSRYSKEYIKLITSMLQVKEKNRPDFIELESNIQHNYYHN